MNIKKLILVMLLWFIFIYFVFLSERVVIDRLAISEKSGIASNFKCVSNPKSSDDLIFTLQHDDKTNYPLSERIQIVNVGVFCSKISNNDFENKKVKLITYNNSYLGIIANGVVIKDMKSSIYEMENRTSMKIFLFIFCLISSLFILINRKK